MSKGKKIALGIGIAIVAIVIILIVVGMILDRQSLVSTYDEGEYTRSSSRATRVGTTDMLGLAFEASSSLKRIAPPSALPAPLPPPPGGNTEEISRLIIKTGQMSLVAKNVEETVKSVTGLVNLAKGFVVESSIRDKTTLPYATMRVRVPAEGFESLIEKVRGLALRVTSELVSGEDVTEEYMDIQARLRNLEASEAQFLKIMEQAVKIQDVLDVQEQLERVRGEIERVEGRKKYLEQSAALSTLTIYIAAEEEALPTLNPQDKWRPKAVLKSAARGFVRTLQALANLVIRLAIFVPIWLPIVLVARYLWRRYKRRKAAAATVSKPKNGK